MTRFTAVYILFVALVAGGFSGYHIYQTHHLSSDLKRTLTAAMDPHNMNIDVQGYLHDAELQIRTKRDAEVVAKFKEIQQIDLREKLRHQKLMDRMRDMNQEPLDNLMRLEESYRQKHMPVPQDLKDTIDQATKSWKDGLAERKYQDSREYREAADDEANREELVAQICADLGCPHSNKQ